MYYTPYYHFYSNIEMKELQQTIITILQTEFPQLVFIEKNCEIYCMGYIETKRVKFYISFFPDEEVCEFVKWEGDSFTHLYVFRKLLYCLGTIYPNIFKKYTALSVSRIPTENELKKSELCVIPKIGENEEINELENETLDQLLVFPYLTFLKIKKHKKSEEKMLKQICLTYIREGGDKFFDGIYGLYLLNDPYRFEDVQVNTIQGNTDLLNNGKIWGELHMKWTKTFCV